MSKKSQLLLIILTAFLDLLGFGILVPILPDIILRFWVNESWTAYSVGIGAIGTFLWGLFFWKWSDHYGRKHMLVLTSALNLIGFSLLYVSLIVPLGDHEWLFWYSLMFLLFIFSRFIWGLWGAWFSVIQAYISDISSPSERTKNMGLTGAAFWFAFLVGPAIGWLLSGFGIATVILGCITAVAINFCMILFYLPEPMKHVSEMHTHHDEFRWTWEVVLFLFLSFGMTLAFSAINSWSSQFYHDIFHFDAAMRGYTMAVVGIVSILYQWWLIRYVRRRLHEKDMLIASLILLSISLALFWYNTNPWLIFVIIPLFPLAMGSFWPSLASLIAGRAGKEVWEVMGYNMSVTSIAQVVWPFLVGTLYTVYKPLPFYVSSIIAFCLFLLAVASLSKIKPS